MPSVSAWDGELNFPSSCCAPLGSVVLGRVVGARQGHPSLPPSLPQLATGTGSPQPCKAGKLGCPSGPSSMLSQTHARKNKLSPLGLLCHSWHCRQGRDPLGARTHPAAGPQIFPAMPVDVFCSPTVSWDVGRASQVWQGVCSSSPVLGRLSNAQDVGLGKDFGGRTRARGRDGEELGTGTSSCSVPELVAMVPKVLQDGWGCLAACLCCWARLR